MALLLTAEGMSRTGYATKPWCVPWLPTCWPPSDAFELTDVAKNSGCNKSHLIVTALVHLLSTRKLHHLALTKGTEGTG